ncbi:hypothetical protein M5X04_04235 [Paenibacillus alvei]|uniref:DUF4145 domain-containing protein n=1 Tax=Paenibacillus alvei TaxID=44250 RepID=A0ABT4E499_PAEAL|nr:hypothetical protein [Paenibacillus alvei]MCY9528544.1 hypothetical protein [Paenibacillus alvei]
MSEELSIDDIVLSYLLTDDTYITPHNIVTLEYPFEIQTNDYLKFSKKDIVSNENETHGTLNALSNAKRALESRVDCILQIYGIKKVGQRIQNLNSFPQKIDLLNKLGLIAPKIMRRINTSRNRMEHDYVEPKKDTVDDFIDVVELFLESTEVITTRFVHEFSLQNESIEYWLDCRYNFGDASFEIQINNNNDYKSIAIHELRFDRKNLDCNNTFKRLFNLVYEVTLNPPYKQCSTLY